MASNRIVHFEIPANQPEALTKFYCDLFGWKFQKAPLPGPEYYGWACDWSRHCADRFREKLMAQALQFAGT